MSKEETKKTLSFGKMVLMSVMIIALLVFERFLLGGITKVEGVKIGLYNMLIVFAVVNMKARDAYLLLLVKIAAGAFLAVQVIFYPLAGGILSITAMVICSKLFKDKIGYAGISIIGALVYNISVCTIASISLQSTAVLYSIPKVLLLSVIYGALTGSFAFVIEKANILRLGFGEKNE